MRILTLIACILIATTALADDFSVQGYAQSDDSWRLSLGYHRPSIKANWYRQSNAKGLSDGYDVTATTKVKSFEVQYKQIHQSQNSLDTQEIATMGTLRGVGLGVARAWRGNFDEPTWAAKAKYALKWGIFGANADWLSNFKNRRDSSFSSRLKLPAYKAERVTLNFTVSGKYQWSKAKQKIKEWWSMECGILLEI